MTSEQIQPGAEIAPLFLTPSGLHDYDIVVGSLCRIHPGAVAGQLARLYPEDFDAVAQALPAHALQVLLPAADYRLVLLAAPQFDPREELQEILESEEALARIEDHPISEALHVGKEVDLILDRVSKLNADAAKALWAALVFAQTSTSDFDRMVAHWSTASYIIDATRAAWAMAAGQASG